MVLNVTVLMSEWLGYTGFPWLIQPLFGKWQSNLGVSGHDTALWERGESACEYWCNKNQQNVHFYTNVLI